MGRHDDLDGPKKCLICLGVLLGGFGLLTLGLGKNPEIKREYDHLLNRAIIKADTNDDGVLQSTEVDGLLKKLAIRK